MLTNVIGLSFWKAPRRKLFAVAPGKRSISSISDDEDQDDIIGLFFVKDT